MLARYRMYRGSRPADDPLPDGLRVDTRRHTRHVLRPPRDLVDAYLADPTDAAWAAFRSGYRAALEERIRESAEPFEALAEEAAQGDVYIGCSCPTKKNPDVRRCHTFLALEFMAERFPALEVVLPEG